ncbi:MAG: hypothetical protein EZS28_021653 [Streblomastix strix]|uniref:Uncharacterized protein n=1 Tax=Streblomastix strix TaxID=222440 RepID=A0A5J4VKF3_9EUKA|nr:MAG: hypothetical protein EZS28_021653 [Streblomastix strix]
MASWLKFLQQEDSETVRAIKAGSKLEEVMDTEEFLGELRQQNAQVVEFLHEGPIITQLLNMVIAAPPGPAPEKIKFARPFLAVEVLTSPVDKIQEMLVLQENMSAVLEWLERGKAPTSLFGTYAAKIVHAMMCAADLMEVRGSVEKMISAIGCIPLSDVYMDIFVVYEELEGKDGFLKWLRQHDLVYKLLLELKDSKDPQAPLNCGQIVFNICTRFLSPLNETGQANEQQEKNNVGNEISNSSQIGEVFGEREFGVIIETLQKPWKVKNFTSAINLLCEIVYGAQGPVNTIGFGGSAPGAQLPDLPNADGSGGMQRSNSATLGSLTRYKAIVVPDVIAKGVLNHLSVFRDILLFDWGKLGEETQEKKKQGQKDGKTAGNEEIEIEGAIVPSIMIGKDKSFGNHRLKALSFLTMISRSRFGTQIDDALINAGPQQSTIAISSSSSQQQQQPSLLSLLVDIFTTRTFLSNTVLQNDLFLFFEFSLINNEYRAEKKKRDEEEKKEKERIEREAKEADGRKDNEFQMTQPIVGAPKEEKHTFRSQKLREYIHANTNLVRNIYNILTEEYEQKKKLIKADEAFNKEKNNEQKKSVKQDANIDQQEIEGEDSPDKEKDISKDETVNNAVQFVLNPQLAHIIHIAELIEENRISDAALNDIVSKIKGEGKEYDWDTVYGGIVGPELLLEAQSKAGMERDIFGMSLASGNFQPGGVNALDDEQALLKLGSKLA